MTAQKLDRVLTCYRIGDPHGAYPLFDAFGSTVNPGRWNTPASSVLYTSEHYSTTLLEKLVHGSGRLPPNQHFIVITIPNGTTYEVLDTGALPDWYLQTCVTKTLWRCMATIETLDDPPERHICATHNLRL